MACKDKDLSKKQPLAAQGAGGYALHRGSIHTFKAADLRFDSQNFGKFSTLILQRCVDGIAYIKLDRKSDMVNQTHPVLANGKLVLQKKTLAGFEPTTSRPSNHLADNRITKKSDVFNTFMNF